MKQNQILVCTHVIMQPIAIYYFNDRKIESGMGFEIGIWQKVEQVIDIRGIGLV